MYDKYKNSFMDIYSQSFRISMEKKVNFGEDSYIYSFNDSAGIIGVFDGCGGSGGKTYSEFENKTGAYISSRIVSACILKWFNKQFDTNEIYTNDSLFSQDIKRIVDINLKNILGKVKKKSNIRSSMQKDFPTTAALCISRSDEYMNIVANVLWSGDSRVYLLDEYGLHQLTIDDVEGEDALSNIFEDGILTNVISASISYKLHEYKIKISEKGIIFAASDGCFGYLPTPMHFEYMILECMIKSNSFQEWILKMQDRISKYTGDDASMCGVVIKFDNYDEMKKTYFLRYEEIKRKYIDEFDGNDNESIKKMWDEYRKEYEKYIERRGADEGIYR